MTNRRDFLTQSAAASVVLAMAGCAGNDMIAYQTAAARIRRPLPINPDFESVVRFATLAPNGHNTQPWHFAELPTGARILPDFTRRTPIVDPDDHHLFISLGCAAENFLIASGAHGRPGAMTFVNEGEGRIEIDHVSGTPQESSLYHAIPLRQSTRSLYDGQAVSAGNLALLAATAQTEGVTLILIT